MNIYPSILTDSILEAQQQLAWAAASEAQVVQLDIIDGFFADNITVAPIDLAVMDFGELQLDLHLMVDEPMDFVFEAEGVKQSLPIRAIIGQLEHMSYQTSFLEEVQKQGWKAGLSLDLATPLESIDDACWDQVDIVQLMSIHAGAQGRTFNPAVMEKLDELALILKQLGRTIEVIVDGGVKPPLIEQLTAAGVTSVTIGSHFWTDAEPVARINELI